MQSNAEWVTYYRHKGGAVVTRLMSEPRPKNFPLAGPATKEEIDTEVLRRESLLKNEEDRAAFEARQDVKDAKFISSAIEFMEPGDGLVDRMTPDQWAALRKLLS